jgi:hypothetical protein
MKTKTKLFWYKAADKTLRASPEIVEKVVKAGLFIGSIFLFKNATKMAKPLRYAGKIKPVGKAVKFMVPMVPMFVRNVASGISNRIDVLSSGPKEYIRKRAESYRIRKIAPKIEGLMKLQLIEQAEEKNKELRARK